MITNGTETITYNYDANVTLLSKELDDGSSTETIDYIAGIEYIEPLCFSKESKWDMLSEIDKISGGDVKRIKDSIIEKCGNWVTKMVPFKITRKDTVGAIYVSKTFLFRRW